jgi:hypothetical protein
MSDATLQRVLLVLLRASEWRLVEITEGYDGATIRIEECPVCCGDSRKGHRDDCELAACIQVLEDNPA